MGQIGRGAAGPRWLWLGLLGMLLPQALRAQQIHDGAGPRYARTPLPVQAYEVPQAYDNSQAYGNSRAYDNSQPAAPRMIPDRILPAGAAGSTATQTAEAGTNAARMNAARTADWNQSPYGGSYASPIAPSAAAGQTVMPVTAESPLVSPTAGAPRPLPANQPGPSMASDAAGQPPSGSAAMPAWLQDAETSGYAAAPPQTADFTALLGRLLLGTFAVLVACVATLWATKQWLIKSRTVPTGQGRIRVLDAAPLAGRGSLQLVEVDGQRLLVGFDSGGMKSMLPMPEPFASTLNGLDER